MTEYDPTPGRTCECGEPRLPHSHACARCLKLEQPGVLGKWLPGYLNGKPAAERMRAHRLKRKVA